MKHCNRSKSLLLHCFIFALGSSLKWKRVILRKRHNSQNYEYSADVFVVYWQQHHPTNPTSLYLPQWKSDQWMYCRLPVSKNTLPLNSWSVSSCVLVANTSSVSWLTLVYCLYFLKLLLQLKAFTRCVVPRWASSSSMWLDSISVYLSGTFPGHDMNRDIDNMPHVVSDIAAEMKS